MSDFELLSIYIQEFTQQGLPIKQALQEARRQWQQQRLPDLREWQLS